MTAVEVRVRDVLGRFRVCCDRCLGLEDACLLVSDKVLKDDARKSVS